MNSPFVVFGHPGKGSPAPWRKAPGGCVIRTGAPSQLPGLGCMASPLGRGLGLTEILRLLLSSTRLLSPSPNMFHVQRSSRSSSKSPKPSNTKKMKKRMRRRICNEWTYHGTWKQLGTQKVTDLVLIPCWRLYLFYITMPVLYNVFSKSNPVIPCWSDWI